VFMLIQRTGACVARPSQPVFAVTA